MAASLIEFAGQVLLLFITCVIAPLMFLGIIYGIGRLFLDLGGDVRRRFCAPPPESVNPVDEPPWRVRRQIHNPPQ